MTWLFSIIGAFALTLGATIAIINLIERRRLRMPKPDKVRPQLLPTPAPPPPPPPPEPPEPKEP